MREWPLATLRASLGPTLSMAYVIDASYAPLLIGLHW
jgi:hypothetical protein